MLQGGEGGISCDVGRGRYQCCVLQGEGGMNVECCRAENMNVECCRAENMTVECCRAENMTVECCRAGNMNVEF